MGVFLNVNNQLNAKYNLSCALRSIQKVNYFDLCEGNLKRLDPSETNIERDKKNSLI